MNRTLLLIAENRADADKIHQRLASTSKDILVLHWARQLPDSLELAGGEGVEAILLDLPLVIRDGIGTLNELRRAMPHIPVLVLSESAHEGIANEVVQCGAWDCLSKDALDSDALARALRCAIQRRELEDALFAERERAHITLNAGSDAILMADVSGKVTYLNHMAQQMTGWSFEAACGQPLDEVCRLVDGITRMVSRNPLTRAIQHDESVELSADCLLIRRDGTECAIEDCAAPLHDRAGQVVGGVIIFRDVTASRAMALKMSHLAQHDFLTDLPNRMLLNDRLAQAITMARRKGGQLALLFLDLDRFKYINDSLGHAVGDQLLQSVTERLLACVRSSDTVSRQGGDEFVVLLAEVENPMDVVAIAEKMLDALAAPHYTAAHDLHISASVGISVYPNDGTDAETLMRHADIAMYHAKENGRNNYQCFRQAMKVRAQERQSIEADLRRALRQQEFELYYQPKINLKTGLITGAEALLRWHHPSRGVMLPEMFVPIAEECGLIVSIGQWVLHEACTQAQAWRDAGLIIDQMAVNISAAEFRDKGFFDKLCATVRDTGFDPHGLQLELTETVLIHDVEATATVFQQLKALGVQLAIDDFGTGYSSLSYLSHFPIDTLKIDQSFVRDMTPDSDEAAIVSAVISMGKSLNQRVVAEGVETPEQLAFLQARHCDEGQGFHFSAALGASEFASLLGSETYRS